MRAFARFARHTVTPIWTFLALASALVSASLAVACTSYAPARTPECNAIINRCMRACTPRSAVNEPRDQSASNGTVTEVKQDFCEQRCAGKC